MLRPRSRLASGRAAGTLTSMDTVAPYLGDGPPVNAVAPRAAEPGSSGDAGTIGMLLVVSVAVAGVALIVGRHA